MGKTSVENIKAIAQKIEETLNEYIKKTTEIDEQVSDAYAKCYHALAYNNADLGEIYYDDGYDKYTTKYTAIVDFSEGSKENVDKAYEDYHFKWDIYVKRLNKMLKVIEEIKSSADTIEKNEEEIYETLKDILKESYEFTNIGDLKEDDYKKLEERKKQQEEQEKEEEEKEEEEKTEEEEKEKEEEQQEKESEEPLKDEQESQHGGDHGNNEEPVYNPPKGTAPSEEKTEGNKQGKTDLETKKSDSTEDKKDDPLKETKTETESGQKTDQGTKKEDEPSTVTPPSDTKTETTTTTTTPTEPQQETYVPPAETNNNNNWQPSNSNNNNNYNNYSNETPINNDVETGEETMTTEPEIPEGSDETAPSSEMPDDEIVKGNEYTKIPTSDTPIETKNKSGNSFIPIAAGLSAAAAAGIGAKAYMDRKNNNDNGEDDFTSEEWDGDESTISDYNTGNKVEIQEDTLEEDPINDNVEPEKYGARNNEELVDIQQ